MESESKSGPLAPAVVRGNRAAPVIERAPLPIVEVQGIAHTVAYVNSAFCQLVGRSRGELVGNPFAEIVPGGSECLPMLNRIYETGEAATVTHEVGADPNPSQWLYAMWPALDENDRPVGVIIQLTKVLHFRKNVAAMNEALLISGLRQHELTAEALKVNEQLEREIGERQRAEAALQVANARLADQASDLERVVAERTVKLRETIGELEAFSHSIAHNMRAPLRGMQGFARLLLDEHSGGLDAAAHTYLERIASSASQMDSLIQDALNYTRVLRSPALLVAVDLDRLVRDMIAINLGWQAPKAEIIIEGTLPRVLGHKGFLVQCVSNLVENAVKFVRPGEMPRLRIWAEERSASSTQSLWPADNGEVAPGWRNGGPVVRVWLADNGVGIAPKDRDRVFRMFERINSAEEFEGTGIGLTIVRKALERMGGRVDFESEAGKGSRFWFELKAAPAVSSEAAG